MSKDRAVICDIISEMLDNPDEVGIYQTGKAYDKLEEYIRVARGEGALPCEACELEKECHNNTFGGRVFTLLLNNPQVHTCTKEEN